MYNFLLPSRLAQNIQAAMKKIPWQYRFPRKMHAWFCILAVGEMHSILGIWYLHFSAGQVRWSQSEWLNCPVSTHIQRGNYRGEQLCSPVPASGQQWACTYGQGEIKWERTSTLTRGFTFEGQPSPCLWDHRHSLSGQAGRLKLQQNLHTCTEKGPNSATHCSNTQRKAASKIPIIHSMFLHITEFITILLIVL